MPELLIREVDIWKTEMKKHPIIGAAKTFCYVEDLNNYQKAKYYLMEGKRRQSLSYIIRMPLNVRKLKLAVCMFVPNVLLRQFIA